MFRFATPVLPFTVSSNVTRLLLLSGLVCWSFAAPAQSHADLVWTFTEDGNGNIRETISGSLNLAGGTDLGRTGAGGQFQLVKFGGTDEVSVGRYTTQTSGRSWGVILNGYDTNPDFELINTDLSILNNWQNTDHLLLQIFNSLNVFRAVDFVGNFTNGPFAISEDVVHDAPFSAINEGVWRYGNLDDDVEGNGVLFTVGNPASVPEPSSCLLLASGLGCTLLRRKRPTY